jgi:hypothetical protein
MQGADDQQEGWIPTVHGGHQQGGWPMSGSVSVHVRPHFTAGWTWHGWENNDCTQNEVSSYAKSCTQIPIVPSILAWFIGSREGRQHCLVCLVFMAVDRSFLGAGISKQGSVKLPVLYSTYRMPCLHEGKLCYWQVGCSPGPLQFAFTSQMLMGAYPEMLQQICHPDIPLLVPS